MAIYRTKLKKETLQKLEPKERSLFFVLAHFANEINALQKFVLWSGRRLSDENAALSGQITLMLMFIRLLAGKLHEANELLNKKFYGTKISSMYNGSLSEEAQTALKEIKQYFRRKNVIDYARNDFAFHYSPNEMDMVLPQVLENELEVYIQNDGSANNLFYFAEVLANKALLQTINSEIDQASYETLINEVTRVTHLFTIVSESLIMEFLRRNQVDIWDGTSQEVSIADLPPFDSIIIPWFTDISTLRNASPNN